MQVDIGETAFRQMQMDRERAEARPAAANRLVGY
jgi:hypothetical protein